MDWYNGLLIILGYLDLSATFRTKTISLKFCTFSVCNASAATFIGLPFGLIVVMLLPKTAYYVELLTLNHKSLFVLYADIYIYKKTPCNLPIQYYNSKITSQSLIVFWF